MILAGAAGTYLYAEGYVPEVPVNRQRRRTDDMLHIDIDNLDFGDGEGDEVSIDIRDENALHACTVLVRTVGDSDTEAIQIEVQRIEDDPRVEFIIP